MPPAACCTAPTRWVYRILIAGTHGTPRGPGKRGKGHHHHQQDKALPDGAEGGSTGGTRTTLQRAPPPETGGGSIGGE